MPATVIVGLQWGDEGKGKTTDFLAEQVAMAVRYQGGDNAGHTVVLGDEVFKLRLTPSGVLYPHMTCVIGPGVVVNPETLIGELDMLTARGIATNNVRVSTNAHVIMPYHVALDRAMEARLDGDKVGTTNRGIGPTYADRASRLGLRMEDLLDEAIFRQRLARVLPDKNTLLASMAGGERFETESLVRQAMAWGERLRPHLADTTWLVQEALHRGDHVILEGAQGTLLDIDHGSYPFVTSSNPIAGGACTGGGIGPLQVDEVIGVMKAYSTRVGSGPYPTELHDATGARIAERGNEFGTVTGRPRRVGWFDAVPLRYAVAVNSVSSIMLNKIDILSGIDRILLCVAYEIDGRRVESWPSSAEVLARATPIYETFPGWSEPINAVRTLAELPENARRYVSALEAVAGVPIVLVSVGPERTQTIERAYRPMRHRPVGPGSPVGQGAPGGPGAPARSGAPVAGPASDAVAR
jgi:adenylosuccinate synthase